MSTLVFNITQFFLSLNYQLLPHIFDKAGFNPKVSLFFQNYLVGQKTQYIWNSFSSSFYNVNVGVSQGSALSLILSALYIFLIFHILENCLKILKIPFSFYLYQSQILFFSIVIKLFLLF